ncbi:MAG: hydrogenase iron-sulfur subunit [Actinomycetota bacterium]|nr:hydrogenase iron-sulfur subunit [Actinomycetota bacterium]
MASDENVLLQDLTPIRIVAFLCNWCSYAGADLAGVSRLSYPANVVTIRVMCSGTVSPYHVLKAFQSGADGVLITGCHIGDCHYLKGNYMTYKRFQVIQGLLQFVGIEPERFRLEWISASEGEKFAETVRDFTEEVGKLGESPLADEREAAKSREALMRRF